MPEEYFWVVIGAGFVLAWGVIVAIVHGVNASARLRAQEMLHRERVLAMEKGIPLPEVVALDDAGDRLFPHRVFRRPVAAAGLALCSVGIGVAISFYFAPLDALRLVWTLGLIPVFLGLGLLLCERLWPRPGAAPRARA